MAQPLDVQLRTAPVGVVDVLISSILVAVERQRVGVQAVRAALARASFDVVLHGVQRHHAELGSGLTEPEWIKRKSA